MGKGLIRVGIELAPGQADDVRRVQAGVLGVDRHEQFYDLAGVERVEEDRRYFHAEPVTTLTESVQGEQPVLPIENTEHAVLFGNLQETEIVVASHRG